MRKVNHETFSDTEKRNRDAISHEHHEESEAHDVKEKEKKDEQDKLDREDILKGLKDTDKKEEGYGSEVRAVNSETFGTTE